MAFSIYKLVRVACLTYSWQSTHSEILEGNSLIVRCDMTLKVTTESASSLEEISSYLTIIINNKEKMLWELIMWSPKRKSFDLLSTLLINSYEKYMVISMEILHVHIGLSLEW